MRQQQADVDGEDDKAVKAVDGVLASGEEEYNHRTPAGNVITFLIYV